MLTAKEIAADIARELREHPEHWTTGTSARDAAGGWVAVDSADAVCWCLFGHIAKRFPRYTSEIHLKPFFDAAGVDWETKGFADINDDKTVEQVIAICDKVAA